MRVSLEIKESLHHVKKQNQLSSPTRKTIMNILLADDDEAYRKSLKLRLESQGCVVFEAGDGIDALELLSHKKIHALVSDVLMPRMDAYQLCYEVRKMQEFEKLPIILYSAIFTSSEDEKNAAESGADFIFRKPIPEDVMLRTLQDLAAGKKKVKLKVPQAQVKSGPLKEYSARLVERLEYSNSQLQARTKELERSELKFRTLASTVAAAIFIYREDQILYVNPAAEILTGYKQEQFSSMSLLDIIHPKYRDMVSERGFAGGVEQACSRFEFRLLTKKGGDRWVDFTASTIDYADEKVTIGTAYDITERKLAEEEIKRAKSYLESILENSLDLIFTVKKDGMFGYMNPQLGNTFGYTREQIVGKQFLDFIPEQRRDFMLKKWGEINAGIFGTYETEVVKADGTLVNCFVSHSVLPGFDEFLVIVKDITELKQAEVELRSTKERLESFFNNTGDAIAIFDLDGTVLHVNNAFETIYGWSAKEVVGTQMPTIPGDLVSDANRILNEVKAGGKVIGYDTIRLRKDRSSFEASLTVSPIRDAAGNVVSIAAISRDITERKRAEEQRRNLEAQLIQAQKTGTVGTLAGGIAHDFNNILGIILAHASLIERSETDRTALMTSAEVIRKAVQRGASLVRQILSFARKTEVSLQPTDVNSVVMELSKMLLEAFPKTITISLQLDKKIPFVTMDQSQFYQALLNLCVNARDAMLDPKRIGQKGGTLSISTAVIEGDEVQRNFQKGSLSQYVKVSVSDTGVGMDQETKQRIFEPFFSTKGAGRGTGLGLAVVYGIVHSDDGFVEVESEIGKGTSFHLYFPASEFTKSSLRGKKGEEVEVPGGTESILLVEDEENLLELLKTVLESKGYHVLTAKDGVEAIQKYMQSKEKIDLVLTDIGLPKLDGAVVFWSLREINPNLNVILASGFLEPQLKSELFKAGAKEFVQKPYETNVILRKIREVLDHSH